MVDLLEVVAGIGPGKDASRAGETPLKINLFGPPTRSRAHYGTRRSTPRPTHSARLEGSCPASR
jgi:hypothetical protein